MREQDAEDILHEYGNMVYRLALVQMKNPSDAEDVVQDTFLQLVHKDPAFENEGHLKAWLIRVALNRCHSLHRSSWWRKTEALPEDLPARETKDNSGLLAEVKRLPQKYRVVIHLHYYEDLPLKTIAHILNVSYDAAAQRLARARKLLKKNLEGVDEYAEFQRAVHS